MAQKYRPRCMPSRFLADAPDIVRLSVLDLIRNPDAVCEFDVILRPYAGAVEVSGVDFDKWGAPGCHFFLSPWQARGYREQSRRRRVSWVNLPEPTRQAIINYLREGN